MGFYAKFAVIKALLGSVYPWAVWLAVFAVIMSLIGAFYYLRVVKIMYFDDKTDEREPLRDTAVTWVLSANALLLLLWGLFPSYLTDWIHAAVAAAF